MAGDIFTMKTRAPEFYRRLSRALDGQVQSHLPLMKTLGEMAKTNILRTFKKQADPVTGSRWPRTSDFTLGMRAGGGGGGKTLTDTGRLRQSIATAIPNIAPRSVSVGTNLPYARIHQRGGSISPKTSTYLAIPANREAKRIGSARRFISQEGGPGEVQWLVGRNGVWGIARKGSEGTEAVLMFILTKGPIIIPRRRFIGVGKKTLSDFGKISGRYFANVVGRDAKKISERLRVR